MFKATRLSKRYEDGTLALADLSLDVANGEIFCLLGANGAGKTTTINLFLGFISPTSGTATVDGVDVVGEPLEARTRVSYVPENVCLYPSFTALQNLDLFARLAGRPDPARRDLEETLIRVGLESRDFRQRAGRFSKGMRQKLGLAIGMVKGAQNVLLDEPTSGLDPKAAAELTDLLSELRDDGHALLISTHDLFTARAVGDRVGIMKDGKLISVLSRDELEGHDLQEIYLDFMETSVS